MNIKQALKRKNKLTGLIQQEFIKMNAYNSVEVGNNRPYSSTESLGKYLSLTEELITLKTAIHKANQPVYDKIFRLSELKSIVKHLKAINCTEGKEQNRYGSTEPIVKNAEISTVERDNMVTSYEEKIDTIQDELDYFNQITVIVL